VFSQLKKDASLITPSKVCQNEMYKSRSRSKPGRKMQMINYVVKLETVVMVVQNTKETIVVKNISV